MNVSYKFKPKESPFALTITKPDEDEVMASFGIPEARIIELTDGINRAIEIEFKECKEQDVSSSRVLAESSKICQSPLELGMVSYCVGAWFMRMLMNQQPSMEDFLKAIAETNNEIAKERKTKKK